MAATAAVTVKDLNSWLSDPQAWRQRPLVMGILNVTPDSFSDGGRFDSLQRALDRAHAMTEAGADMVDVGGESTRPGADAVAVGEELERVIPVIEALSDSGLALSIDTSKPEVMTAAAAAGAVLINDVWALRRPGALQAAAATGLPVCLMHMQGEPGTMQQAPAYDDVSAEVRDFLADRIAACEAAGIPASRLLLDPGFGFGKQLQHNLSLLRDLPKLGQLKRPILAGLSRKSMLGQITGAATGERQTASAVAAAIAWQQGASVLRVHDVRATVEALAVAQAVAAAQSS